MHILNSLGTLADLRSALHRINSLLLVRTLSYSTLARNATNEMKKNAHTHTHKLLYCIFCQSSPRYINCNKIITFWDKHFHNEKKAHCIKKLEKTMQHWKQCEQYKKKTKDETTSAKWANVKSVSHSRHVFIVREIKFNCHHGRTNSAITKKTHTQRKNNNNEWKTQIHYFPLTHTHIHTSIMIKRKIQFAHSNK